MRDLQIGFDAVEILRLDQVERPVLFRQFCREFDAGRGFAARHKPAAGDFRAGDFHPARAVALRAQHEIERHRQARRAFLEGAAGARQAVDQADLAAADLIEKGAVHPVDDACEREARVGGVKLRAIEQLEIEPLADADGFFRKIGLVPLGVAVELAIDGLPHLWHRW